MTNGTGTATLAFQAANTFLAGPSTGTNTTPTFRALVSSDLPASPTISSNLSVDGNLSAKGSTNQIGNDVGTSVNRIRGQLRGQDQLADDPTSYITRALLKNLYWQELSPRVFSIPASDAALCTIVGSATSYLASGANGRTTANTSASVSPSSASINMQSGGYLNAQNGSNLTWTWPWAMTFTLGMPSNSAVKSSLDFRITGSTGTSFVYIVPNSETGCGWKFTGASTFTPYSCNGTAVTYGTPVTVSGSMVNMIAHFRVYNDGAGNVTFSVLRVYPGSSWETIGTVAAPAPFIASGSSVRVAVGPVNDGTGAEAIYMGYFGCFNFIDLLNL